MSAPPLPGVLGDLAPVLNHWGYWAVGGLLFVEDFGVPAPGETILIAAALYAGAGQLNIAAVIVIGIAAAILGDNVGYLIGRTGGHSLVLRYGKYVLLTPERFEKAERFFTRHGGKVVTIARFVEGLRQANGIIAGTTKMPWRRFLVFNALGAALWVGVWAGLGYAAGDHITTIYREVNRYSLYVLAALGAVVAALIARAVVRRRRAAPTSTPPDPR
ncbi:DedA family protein [Actinacidiphila sp. DG2A-62]|uniref:DedA family protein n=1 Tax=Actinacidiphila sp. DG2A-62 TaxID=3108821 RepID=UPI002DBB589D|nr:DedA family protein [Actinacidiphila sp. DG2A-62]MEC3992523.1 DedA family protein [Actinacidiphila sp. DG2A-62]